jgi:thiosulfate dehydrogenase
MKRAYVVLAASALACGKDVPPAAAPPATAVQSSPQLSDSAVLAGPMGPSIERGRAILTATKDSLPQNVGSKLRCSSCHLDAGMRKNGLLLAGVYGRYPQYRTRTGGVVTLEARINDCFERSLNGHPISPSSSAMTDLVAYMWFISRGVPVDGKISGQGIKKLTVTRGDTLRGQGIFAANCVACHGADGGGTAAAPPLWGPHSFNIGAAMTRVQTSSAFIRYNMPFDRPGVLTDQQATDVAAYLGSRSRPDFKGKENDWPKGEAPDDVPYAIKSAKSGG